MGTSTDLWAFGCCLYEALTGRRAFEGDGVTATLARVIEREPDWSILPPSLPRTMTRLLHRCLRKSRRDRVRHAGDARLELFEGDDGLPDSRAISGGPLASYGAVALGEAHLRGVTEAKPTPKSIKAHARWTPDGH